MSREEPAHRERPDSPEQNIINPSSKEDLEDAYQKQSLSDQRILEIPKVYKLSSNKDTNDDEGKIDETKEEIPEETKEKFLPSTLITFQNTSTPDINIHENRRWSNVSVLQNPKINKPRPIFIRQNLSNITSTDIMLRLSENNSINSDSKQICLRETYLPENNVKQHSFLTKGDDYSICPLCSNIFLPSASRKTERKELPTLHCPRNRVPKIKRNEWRDDGAPSHKRFSSLPHRISWSRSHQNHKPFLKENPLALVKFIDTKNGPQSLPCLSRPMIRFKRNALPSPLHSSFHQKVSNVVLPKEKSGKNHLAPFYFSPYFPSVRNEMEIKSSYRKWDTNDHSCFRNSSKPMWFSSSMPEMSGVFGNAKSNPNSLQASVSSPSILNEETSSLIDLDCKSRRSFQSKRDENVYRHDAPNSFKRQCLSNSYYPYLAEAWPSLVCLLVAILVTLSIYLILAHLYNNFTFKVTERTSTRTPAGHQFYSPPFNVYYPRGYDIIPRYRRCKDSKVFSLEEGGTSN